MMSTGENLVGDHYPVLFDKSLKKYNIKNMTAIISAAVRSARELAILALKYVQFKISFENIKRNARFQ